MGVLGHTKTQTRSQTIADSTHSDKKTRQHAGRQQTVQSADTQTPAATRHEHHGVGAGRRAALDAVRPSRLYVVAPCVVCSLCIYLHELKLPPPPSRPHLTYVVHKDQEHVRVSM